MWRLKYKVFVDINRSFNCRLTISISTLQQGLYFSFRIKLDFLFLYLQMFNFYFAREEFISRLE